MAGCEVNMTSLCLCLSPGLSLVIVTGLLLALCGPAGLSHSAPGYCDAALSSQLQREEGGLQSALIVKCPAQAETGCDLSLAWAGVRGSDIS